MTDLQPLPEGNQRVQDQRLKLDNSKDPWHLLPFDAIRGIVKVLAFGAGKYAARGWEAGMEWSRCYAALMRHMTAWWEGEGKDQETGYSHLWHAGCCILFLIAYEIRGIGTDDRPVPETKLPSRLHGVESETSVSGRCLF
jgi:hypothetical protein